MMRALVVGCFLMGVCFAAEPSARPSTIPPGAVETAPSCFRYTDAGGTTWLLRKTPFGVAAVEEKASELIKATDAGDSVRFEQANPFGTHTWVKKKSQLDEAEREVWDRLQSRERTK